MPKERRERSVSFNKSRASPFPCNASRSSCSMPKNLRKSNDNMKQWEEVRCPVCMEHPHNAILLLCSSHEKGCRPFMCDTSHRHSNCFDQFRKSFPLPKVHPGEETSFFGGSSPVPNMKSEENMQDLPGVNGMSFVSSENQDEPKLVCPLCRGQLYGWMVVEAARLFMNSKSRSCSCETCEFTGNYADLRKHARSMHPRVRPSEADPERQRDWRRMERQRDLDDLFSSLGSVEDEGGEHGIPTLYFLAGPLSDTPLFLFRIFLFEIWLGVSRARGHTVSTSPMTRQLGESFDEDSRGGNNETRPDTPRPREERISSPRRRRQRSESFGRGGNNEMRPDTPRPREERISSPRHRRQRSGSFGRGGNNETRSDTPRPREERISSPRRRRRRRESFDADSSGGNNETSNRDSVPLGDYRRLRRRFSRTPDYGS